MRINVVNVIRATERSLKIDVPAFEITIRSSIDVQKVKVLNTEDIYGKEPRVNWFKCGENINEMIKLEFDRKTEKCLHYSTRKKNVISMYELHKFQIIYININI